MMICPKCNVEYQAGFVKCSDCDIDLLPNSKRKNGRKDDIKRKGISIVKYGIGLLFFTVFQIILTVIVYEFIWVYRLSNGGVSGTPIDNVNPIIWFLIVIQLIISIGVICWGSSINGNDNTLDLK